jgi:hypothetical protein
MEKSHAVSSSMINYGSLSEWTNENTPREINFILSHKW